nr:DUF4214 domain-containing protein [Tianweitania sediminis]
MFTADSFEAELVEASATRIVLSDGADFGVYYGEGFTYDASGLTGGTLTGYAAYVGSVLAIEVGGLAVDAITAGNLINANNLLTLFSVALAGNDEIAGSNGDDALAGFTGNDIIDAGQGANYIDGGEGFDFAAYANPLSTYSFDIANGNLLVSSTDGLARDTIAGVERLLFSDVALAFDTGAVQAFRLYQAAFDRAPDLGGVSFWVNKIDTGTSLLSAAASFIGSDEFRSLYGTSPTDEQFVDLLYENVLNRAADASGYSYWIGRMDTGLSREAVLLEFSESPENQSNTAASVRFGVILDYNYF